ncbi:Flp pilus assembly complex ATPase component TadA, partial [Candidatus Babeliales bacterium]|nr:Flp pilus assembly complex ATPase component TadA [Candidatus Babeliales bacterium]
MFEEKIGEMLVSWGTITPEQLEDVIHESQRLKQPLSRVLLERKLALQEDIARALAVQLEIPFVERILENMVDQVILGKVSFQFLRRHVIIPLMLDGKPTVLTSNPRDLQPLDDIALLIPDGVAHAVAPKPVIMDAINKYYPFDTGKQMMEELKDEEEEEFDLESIEEKDLMDMANDAPIVKLVNHIIFQAVKDGASDIHIEPFEKELSVRYRIDGVMHQMLLPPKRYHGAIVSRLKIMSNLNIAEKRVPQDGRIQVRVAEKTIDLRVSILPCNFGERVSMRILDKSKGANDLESLKMSELNYDLITSATSRPYGIILVSGPTGSGKTTTLYSILKRLNNKERNIITVEDPVEYTINGISQVQVNEKAGLTFASALRSILRQDPDMALIGEIRDGETAQIATQAALTGHLVLSTIHTNDAPSTITRLIDMGVEPFLVSSSLICVIAQRLVRILCDACKEQYCPSPQMLAKLGISALKAKKMIFFRAVGCEECLNTGYKGRMAIFEVMNVDDTMASLIVQRVDASLIRQHALGRG